jgi:hypothetical protein
VLRTALGVLGSNLERDPMSGCLTLDRGISFHILAVSYLLVAF